MLLTSLPNAQFLVKASGPRASNTHRFLTGAALILRMRLPWVLVRAAGEDARATRAAGEDARATRAVGEDARATRAAGEDARAYADAARGAVEVMAGQ
jgi:hypothetical protein